MEPSHHSSPQATATVFSFCHLNRSPHPQATTPPTNTNSQVTYSHDNSIIANQHSSSANKQHISLPISQQHAYQDTTDSHASKVDTSPLHSHGSTTFHNRPVPLSSYPTNSSVDGVKFDWERGEEIWESSAKSYSFCHCPIS